MPLRGPYRKWRHTHVFEEQDGGTLTTDRVEYIVRTAHGFKFYLPLDEPNPLRRFFKAHLSDAYSGEVHVDTADQERVVAVLNRYGVSCR